MEEKSISSKALKGFSWKFLERVSVQIINFIVQIVLARMLLPEEYGIVALISLFILICDTIIKTGLNTALIQKQDVDALDLSSVFWGNLGVSLILYGILFLGSSAIAEFFKQPLLKTITKIVALNIVVGGVSSVSYALLSKKLQFRKSFLANLINVVVHGVIGIYLAYLGWGVWALVYSTLIATIFYSIAVIVLVGWFPNFIFSGFRLKNLFRFSSKILGVNLMNVFFNNLYTLIIGRFFTSSSLAYYQRGQSIPQTVMTSVDGGLTEVMYPVYSMLQNDKDKLLSTIRSTLKLGLYVTIPLMIVLCMISKPLTIILLTKKWIESVPFMQLSCIICCFWPLSTMNHAINALGHSNATFKLNVIGKSISIICILVCIPFGAFAIMLGGLISSMISLPILFRFYKKYLNYSFKLFFKDVLPIIKLTGVIAIVLYCELYIPLSNGIILIIQLISGIAVYLIMSYFCKIESFFKILNYAKTYLRKK